ncbi:hypothetical protein IJH06_02450 [Candidatus Saccharibacteria bacterium]|nr:hypothetical protein [Candidatus Saccharibacteria bacterium]
MIKHKIVRKLATLGMSFVVSFATILPVYNVTAIELEASEKITATYPYYAFIEDEENPWSSAYDALDATDTIEYSDEYFASASYGDHPELRAVSYALALAGYENRADGYPTTTTDANPKLTAFLDQLGFSDYQSWDETSEEDGHSFGTTIGHKTLSTGQELVVVAPRNYNYMTEWLSNFNVGTSGDHAGFSESADLMLGRFDQYISEHDFSSYKVWVVGYSRGGAVVDLFAKKINTNLSDYSMTPEDFYVYTFGAPRASVTETKYSNIHDVKDGNDLLLGYVFPEVWGFYNTGIYEEIHPADLNITTMVVDISELADSSSALNLLSSNDGVVEKIGAMNGQDFMDAWTEFITSAGLTREYFDTEVKAPLSALMKAYQLRTLDNQSEFLNFIKDTDTGMAGMVAGNAFMDLLTGGYGSSMEEALANFPPYLDLVKILRGTATEADIDEFLDYLVTYIGNYDDYVNAHSIEPAATEDEFTIIKENLPKLVKALAPIIVADAEYTQDTFGEDYSLYYTYSLVSNAEKLVTGHIPESIMPILKSLIPEEETIIPKAPNTGKGY